MKLKLTIVLALIGIVPLAIAGWLGARIVRDEQVVVEHRFRELILAQLRGVDAELARALERYEVLVLAEMEPRTADRHELRRRTRESPYALQFYQLDSVGGFVYPPVSTPSELTAAERESLRRTRAVWDGGALQQTVPAVESPVAPASSAQPSAADRSTGWHTWYWDSGSQWMFWSRDAGGILAAEINRTRLLAELISALPETDLLAPQLAEGRIRLVESGGKPLYQWGAHEAEEDALPLASLPVGPPFGGWTLEYYAPGAVLGAAVTGGFLLNLLAGLALLAATVIGLTYYFYREQSREMREAAQRVSFVNQVSHELKTPLTNIRMYAELLENEMEGSDGRSQRHLGVIVSESQRLSRLIGNVLSFGRRQRGTLEVHRQPGVVDDVLRSVLGHFGPALQAAEIEVAFTPDAATAVRFDADAVEQIVGNLISNVEKYAASGKHMEVTSRHDGDTVEITLADRGPGLPTGERQRIFEPFYRVNSSTTEGVGGTGIGLAIARELARMHGGDLKLESSERGARFRLTLQCPAADDGVSG